MWGCGVGGVGGWVGGVGMCRMWQPGGMEVERGGVAVEWKEVEGLRAAMRVVRGGGDDGEGEGFGIGSSLLEAEGATSSKRAPPKPSALTCG